MNATVIDIGSPEKSNIGWAVVGNRRRDGTRLDAFIHPVAGALAAGPVMLGFETPMFLPIRNMEAERARNGASYRLREHAHRRPKLQSRPPCARWGTWADGGPDRRSSRKSSRDPTTATMRSQATTPDASSSRRRSSPQGPHNADESGTTFRAEFECSPSYPFFSLIPGYEGRDPRGEVRISQVHSRLPGS